jgi:hypothetical protein
VPEVDDILGCYKVTKKKIEILNREKIPENSGNRENFFYYAEKRVNFLYYF